MATGGPNAKDPIAIHHWSLEAQGVETALFTECSSIDNETQALDFYQTDKSGTVYHQLMPGNSKWSPVTLKRGITIDNKIFEWRDQVIKGQIDKARVDITLSGHAPDNSIVMQYVLTRAWPSKYQGPNFSAKANDAGLEVLVLAHEGATRTK